MGCYDDFEAGRRLRAVGLEHGGDASDPVDPGDRPPAERSRMCKVAVLSTFTHRSSDLADIPIVFKPGTDLAILNYIANHIISTGRVNQDFVDNHTTFVQAARPISAMACGAEHPLETKATGAADPGGDDSRSTSTPMRAFVKDYTLEKVVATHRRRARLAAGARPSSMPTRSAR